MDDGIIKNLESCRFEVFVLVVVFFGEEELLLLTESGFYFHFCKTAGNAQGYTDTECEKNKTHSGGGQSHFDIIFVERFPSFLCIFLECSTVD